MRSGATLGSAAKLAKETRQLFYLVVAKCLHPFIKHFVCPFSGHFRGQYTHFLSLRQGITRHPPYSFTLAVPTGPLIAKFCLDLIRRHARSHHGS